MGEMGMARAAQRRVGAQRRPIDIEDLLIWTYRDQKADRVIDAGRGLHQLEAAMDRIEIQASSGCGCAQVAAIQRLGVRVDGGGCHSGALDPDAELVHHAVLQLTARVHGLPGSRLVISYAATASRPDEMACQMSRPLPLLAHDGRVRVDWLDKGKRHGVCPVRYTPSATAILQAREEYTAWRELLMLLTLSLQADRRMQRFYPLPPAAPEAPWIESA